MDSDTVRDFINEHDRFSASNNIRITRAEPGYAEGELEITPDSMNSRGFVQGGAIFTLCDLTAAGAANAGNDGMIAMQGSISFIRPGTGKKLRSAARQLSRGRNTGVFAVDVFNDAGKLVAHATINGFATGEPLVKE
ncbi:MAG: PaaI family thioesterase [Lentisphaeria bacterium]|nr:PaaI family thioesterase [Lentisphaeria bacterium]